MKKIAWLKSKDGNKQVGVFVDRKEFPKIKFGYDSTWLIGGVYFKDSDFEVKLEDRSIFEMPILKKFVRDLGKIVKKSCGSAEYIGTEPYFTVSVDIGKTGTGKVKGKIWNVEVESVSLEFDFNFNTDQSCVKIFWKDLKGLLKN